MRTINLSDNDGGLIEGTTGEGLPRNFTPDAKNVDIDLRGMIRLPRRGYRPYLPAPLVVGKPVTGLWFHRRLDGTNTILACCDESIFEILPNKSMTQHATGLAGGRARWHGVPYQGELFITNGHNPPKVFNTELRNLADLDDVQLPLDWSNTNFPRYFSVIALGGNQHLAAFGFHRTPSAISFCAADNYLDWRTMGDAFGLAPLEGSGETIRTVFSYKDYVVCLAQTEGVVYYGLDPSNLMTADAKKIPFGSSGMGGVVYLEDDVWWISQDGPISLQGVLARAGVAAEYATHRIPETVKQINLAALDNSVGINDRQFGRASWFLPWRRNELNNLRLDYYYQRRVRDHEGMTQGAWMLNEGVSATCAVVFKNSGGHVVLLGGNDGMIYQANYTYDDNGTAISPCYYRWPILEPGSKVRVAEIDFSVQRGGENARARLFYTGREAAMRDSLAPNVENGTVCRMAPFGYGYDGQLMVEHLGGVEVCELKAVRMRVDIAGIR